LPFFWLPASLLAVHPGNASDCKPLPDSPTDPRRSAAERIMAGLGPAMAATELGFGNFDISFDYISRLLQLRASN